MSDGDSPFVSVLTQRDCPHLTHFCTERRNMEDWIDHDETIFENKFEYTTPLLKELYKGMLKWDKRRRMNMIFIYVLLGINIAMNILFIIIGNYDLFRLLLISLGLLAAVVIFRALEPVILARSVMKNYQKRYNEPMDVYTTFDEDYMTTHDVSLGATAQRALTYDSITSVHESENFIVLRLDKRQVMSILKTGFIKGNVDDFRTFIMRKIHEAEEGYENVDIDTGDMEEDRDTEPVYTAPQEVEDTLGDVDGVKAEEAFEKAPAANAQEAVEAAQEGQAQAAAEVADAPQEYAVDEAADAAEALGAEAAEGEPNPYKASDAFKK